MSEVKQHWFWRMMTYPIPVLSGWRGRGRKSRASAAGLIESSVLPANAKARVSEVVQRSRLWKREKAEVATELIAHFQDGLAAGRTAEELVSSFGEAKTAARLIRRGKKRNRPLWWQAQRRVLQTVGALLVVYIGLGVLLAVRHPNPSVDYVAQLNRLTQQTSVSDHAAPIYREAWRKARIWELNDDVFYAKDADGKATGRALMPGEAGWPAVAEVLRAHGELLAALRLAGLKPVLGWDMSVSEISDEDCLAMYGKAGPPRQAPTNRVDELSWNSVMQVRLPYLSVMRWSTKWLAADMRLAASEGDTQRVVTDYLAMVGMGRQCGQTSLLINELVELGIIGLADQAVVEINLASPEELSKCRVELLHAMAGANPRFTMTLGDEKSFLLDTIQRVYSDDGHGDGAPTLDGLRVLMNMAPVFGGPKQDELGHALRVVSMPAAPLLMASRKEATQQVELLYALSEQDAARPLWIKVREPGKCDGLIRGWKTGWGSIRYGLLNVLAPAFGKAGIAFDRSKALHEVAMVALALEVYRGAIGRYPDSLSELVPRYLPADPLDYSSGGPLRYKLVAGKPLLYGLGKDGVDDGGVWTDKKTAWPQIPDKGDWVLYPPVQGD